MYHCANMYAVCNILANRTMINNFVKRQETNFSDKTPTFFLITSSNHIGKFQLQCLSKLYFLFSLFFLSI